MHSFFHAHYSRGKNISDFHINEFEGNQTLIHSFIDATKVLRRENVANPRIAVLCENRILTMLTILCAGLSPFPQAIEAYWKAVGFSSIYERASFANKELAFLQDTGPIVGLGSYMGWQATKGHNNGNYLDCFHFAYLPYVEAFYTDDQAFHEFVKEYPESEILKKIKYSDELLSIG